MTFMSGKSIIPNIWDGFGFYRDIEGLCKYFFFDEMAQEYGDLPTNPDIPADRKAFHVILCSIRKNRTHIELPFTSNFTDAFAYAENLCKSGFTGLMFRETTHSLHLVERALLEIMQYHAKRTGFMFRDAEGVEQWHKGLIKENEE